MLKLTRYKFFTLYSSIVMLAGCYNEKQAKTISVANFATKGKSCCNANTPTRFAHKLTDTNLNKEQRVKHKNFK